MDGEMHCTRAQQSESEEEDELDPDLLERDEQDEDESDQSEYTSFGSQDFLRFFLTSTRIGSWGRRAAERLHTVCLL